MDLQRWLDEQPPEYPQAQVALIDALRDYIRCNQEIEEELLSQGSITPEDVKREKPHLDRCRALLRELEKHGPDPSLCGIRA